MVDQTLKYVKKLPLLQSQNLLNCSEIYRFHHNKILFGQFPFAAQTEYKFFICIIDHKINFSLYMSTARAVRYTCNSVWHYTTPIKKESMICRT